MKFNKHNKRSLNQSLITKKNVCMLLDSMSRNVNYQIIFGISIKFGKTIKVDNLDNLENKFPQCDFIDFKGVTT